MSVRDAAAELRPAKSVALAVGVDNRGDRGKRGEKEMKKGLMLVAFVIVILSGTAFADDNFR